MLPSELVRTLVAIADTGSLDAAARRLAVTPSAVSQRLKSLETLVGRVVLVRSKPARLTEAGDALVRFARQTQQLEEETLRSLGITPDGGRVRVTVRLDTDLRAQWASAIAAAASEMSMDLDVYDEDAASEHRSDQLAIAITTDPDESPGWTTSKLGSVRYDAVASSRFVERWGLLRARTPDRGEPPAVVVRGRERRLRTFLAQQAHASRMPLTTVSSTEMAVSMVEAGCGWALLPRTVTESLLRVGRLQRFSTAHAHEDYYLQRWGYSSPTTDALMRNITVHARHVFERHGFGIDRGGSADASI